MNDVSAELLDVVDIDDQVVDVKQRGQIHAERLMHRAVHILLFNASGELFLQKRSMTKDECPGLWDSSAAGHVDSGESYLDCAVREIEEELGIVPDQPLEFLFHQTPEIRNGMEHSHIYRFEWNGTLKLQASEIDEGRWVSVAEIDQRTKENDPSLTDVVKMIWSNYRDEQEKVK